MLNDLALIITALGSTARVEGDTIAVGGERITCTMTGRVVASNDSHRIVLGTVRDGGEALAHAFINNFR